MAVQKNRRDVKKQNKNIFKRVDVKIVKFKLGDTAWLALKWLESVGIIVVALCHRSRFPCKMLYSARLTVLFFVTSHKNEN